jgi:hypothetical protein
MQINNVISFESQFSRRVIKSKSNVQLIEDSTSFMSDSGCKRTGGGLIYKYRQNVYLLSCSHIFPHKNKSVYCFGDREFEMHPFISLKEMDVVIFKCESGDRHAQFDMEEYLSDFKDKCGEYKLITPDNTYDAIDVDIIHESNVSPLYPTIPTVVAKIPTIPPDKLCGISGSVITCNDYPIGLVSNYDSEYDIIKCMHIPFILAFVKLVIDKNIVIRPFIELTGVHIDTDICEIEYSSDDTNTAKNAHYIKDDSTEYIRDIHTHIFEKDSLILNVNNNTIDEDGLISCTDILGIPLKISLGAYSMISTTLENAVSYSIINQRLDDRLVPISVKGIPYDNIFKTHPLDDRRRIIWNNYLFCEMSTEIIWNYEAKGMVVSESEKSNINQYYNGFRRIILLTYIESGEREHTKKMCKFKFPLIQKGSGIYFMTLVKVGVNNVKNINHLYDLLSGYKSNEASFTFTTFVDGDKKQKIYI